MKEMIDTARFNRKLAKVVSIGKTVKGRDIMALKLTKDADTTEDGAKPAVLYLSNQHAREWITPEMTRRLMQYYLAGYGKDPRLTKILDTTELWFVLSANPDGYDYTFESPQNRMWRKNLRDNNGDGKITPGDGVDLNRNFSYKWGYDNEGSSPNPSSETYRGPAAASEPETKALDAFEKRIGFRYAVNYHSAAELILYGVAGRSPRPPPTTSSTGPWPAPPRSPRSPATARRSPPSSTPPTARPTATPPTSTASPCSPRRCPPARPRRTPTPTTSGTPPTASRSSPSPTPRS